MRIDDLRQESDGEWITLSARLTWEDNDRPTQRVVFQAPPALVGDLECSPNAFLAAAAVPAMHFGERRLRIEGAVCPVLHDGLLTILTLFREWYGKERVIPAIEPAGGFIATRPRTPNRAAQFFSGGIDALATLRRNRLMYPVDHPGSIRDCYNVFGMHPDDYRGSEPNPARVAFWDHTLRQLRGITDAANVELFQLRTNVVGVFKSGRLFSYEYHSAIMLSLAHLLTRRASDVLLASSHYLDSFGPWGSHPLIDPCYGSSAVRIHHDGIRLKRLEKVRLIAEWPAALSMLNVCSNFKVPEAGINCGRCEKCLRTMLQLLVCKKLDQCPTFPSHDVDPQLISQINLRSPGEVEFVLECVEHLRAMGRLDLIAAIRERVADYNAWKRRQDGYGLTPKLKKLDKQLLGGWMRRRWLARQQSGV